jgi:two-component system sensor histidine kinase/response regulator
VALHPRAEEPLDAAKAPDEIGAHFVPRRTRLAFGIFAAVLVALLISLIVRRPGSYNTLVDGFGVALFEFTMGNFCIARYFEGTWRTSNPVARLFPLVMGVACISWALGDLALTIESLGGATPPVPSFADAFYVAFFPLCFAALALLIRRGNRSSLLATSLDGLIAGFGLAALSSAFVVAAVVRVTGGGALSAGTQLAYPLGDLLLFALCVGGLMVLPRGFRPFFVIVCIALAANAIGDGFNLLQPTSKFGYIANGAAWPISLTLVAVAVWILPPRVESPGTDRIPGFALPAIGVAISLGILVVASFVHIGRPAVALATITLLVASIRLAITVREAHSLKTARFRSLIDKTWDLITVIESDFRIAYITPSAERVIGYSPGELQGKLFTDLVHPDDAQSLVSNLIGLTHDHRESAVFEVRMRHVSGVWRTIDWNAADLLADPSVNGYVLNGGDVTEARQAAADLLTARDAALVASKTKSEFVSTMSHEIRTPMNGVIGLTELLLQTELDDEQLELASGVKVSAESLLVIINDILDFSKIEAGKLEIEESPLNLLGVVDDVGRILAGTAHAKDIELLIDVHPDVPSTLLGDGTRIRQVLLNFGSNAVKFTSDGEVVIRVSVLHKNSERVALHFDVVDTGIGIKAEDQERLFSAFAQADSSTTRRFGGTGLGLTISRQLVELMGGRLGLTSSLGEGSTFWFELSLRRADDVPSLEKGADHRSLSGQRALVVDDNATNRRILRQQLLSWGVEAVEAADGFQALDLALTAAHDGRTFDLGVVDLNMPGMDGIELAHALKADPATSETMLFLLSSSGQRLEAAESHLTGFAASLTKPVRSSELFDCLITSLNSGSTLVPTATPARKRSEISKVAGLILLVEDNKVNQLVGSKVLQNLGYSFTIANNGVEAVSAFRSGTYDAIIMDCQMPEMDGYEATAAIRQSEGSASHIPIIAMTAAAMEGDREKCIAAGMDDFVTKPIRLDAVSTALARWVKRSQPEPEDIEEAVTHREEADPLDRSQIELLLSLDDGEGGVLAEIVTEFLSASGEGRSELLRVLGDGDSQALARAAHTLKGASANVGANKLAEVCGGLELHARQAQIADAEALVDQFETEFARATEALAAVSARV